MKKKSLFIFTLTLLTTWALAQHDPKAFDILEAMSHKYQQLKSFEAMIGYSMVNKVDGINEKFTGKITVQGDKFRLSLNEQEIINNGKTVWTYMPSAEEVVIDDTDPDEISPSKFYSIYKKGYKYLYLEEKKIGGELCSVIDLVPEKKNAQFFKIRMNITTQDKRVKSWILFDRSGTQYQYTINKFMGNKKVSDSFFAFNASEHPDAEVVDLR